MSGTGKGGAARKLLAVAALTGCFFSVTAIAPPRAHAFWSMLAGVVEDVGEWVLDTVKGGAKQAAMDALKAAKGGSTTETIWQMIKERDYVSAIGIAGIMVLKWVSDLLKVVNNVVFGFIFGDLLMLIDYKKLPGDAGRHVNRLYGIMAYIGESLAFFFFIISQGLLLFKLSSKRAWKDILVHVRRFAAVLIIIPVFPHLFSLSLSLTAIISDKIMSEKIKGEVIRHAPGGMSLEGSTSFSSPATGLDLLGDKINYYLTLPDTIVEDAVAKGKEAVNKVVTSVQDSINKTLDNTVNKALDDTVGKGIDGIAKQFGLNAVSGTDGGAESGAVISGVPTAMIYAVVGYIINALIEITSLTLSLSLLTLKGFQLAALMLLYICAPLILAFMVLPSGDSIGFKYFKSYLGLLGWNIIWAVGIKIYGIVGLMVNIINNQGGGGLQSLLGYGAAGVLPFAGVFMKLGVLTIMVGVAGWVGIVAVAAIGAASANMGGQLASLTAAGRVMGGFNRMPAAVGASGVGLAQGLGRAVGAVKNPLGFVSSLGGELISKTSVYGKAYQAGVAKSTGEHTRERMAREKMGGASGSKGREAGKGGRV